MIPTFTIEQVPEESAPQAPVSNTDVTQHQPDSSANWQSWLIIGLAALAIYSYVMKRG